MFLRGKIVLGIACALALTAVIGCTPRSALQFSPATCPMPRSARPTFHHHGHPGRYARGRRFGPGRRAPAGLDVALAKEPIDTIQISGTPTSPARSVSLSLFGATARRSAGRPPPGVYPGGEMNGAVEGPAAGEGIDEVRPGGPVGRRAGSRRAGRRRFVFIGATHRRVRAVRSCVWVPTASPTSSTASVCTRQRTGRVAELSGSFPLGGYALDEVEACRHAAAAIGRGRSPGPVRRDRAGVGRQREAGLRPADAGAAGIELAVWLAWRTAIVVRAHTRDPEAAACSADKRAACEAAVVVEAVVWSARPSANATPTPRPRSPEPPRTRRARCLRRAFRRCFLERRR